MNNNRSAFPNNITPEVDYYGHLIAKPNNTGMTLKEYAAIHLKVPRSGNGEIDGMIRESVRRDFAGKALTFFQIDGYTHEEAPDVSKHCFGLADVMLAEWEKVI
jgi:hypothetical protein